MTPSRLSPEDRVLLRSDREPRSRVTIGGLALLDRRPDWDLLRQRIDRASRVVPALRDRAVEPTFSTTEPRWVIDPDFVLDRHVRHVALPGPGDRTQLLELVERFVAAPFDPTGPLWRLLCVDGVGKGSAVLTAVSPLLRFDGEPLDLLGIALSDAADDLPLEPIPVPTDLEPVDLAKAGVHELPRRAVSLALGGIQEAGALALHAATDWRGAIDRATALVTPPPTVQGSALMAGRGTERVLVTRTFARARVDAGGQHRGGQRAHIAAIREALLAYHQAMGLPLTSLGMTAANHPASLRRALAPSHDPVDALGRLLPLLPTGVIDSLARPSRGSDIAVSHLQAGAGSVGPARVTERYVVGPVPGNALTSVAVTSPDGLHVAVRFDPEAIKDRALFERCLDEAFDAVLGVPVVTTSAAGPAKAAPKAASRAAAPRKAAAKRAAASTTKKASPRKRSAS